MKRHFHRVKTQLAVIGTGMAGFAASIFARGRGIDVAQIGHAGAMAYTTGYLDLVGVHEGSVLDDPWAGLDALRRDEPQNPLGLLSNADIRSAIGEFVARLGDMGLGYTAPGDGNLQALLPFGTTKPTLCVPDTMYPGIEAHRNRADTLIVGFEGLQGFSAAEFCVNIARTWPRLRHVRLSFPGMEGGQVFPEVMARALETAEARSKLADLIRPELRGASHVGLPAILGMRDPGATRSDLEGRLGATVFEIPTMPPAVPGIRLRETFERALPGQGLRLEPQSRVHRLDLDRGKVTLHMRGAMDDVEIEASAVILATGRFLSGGLTSDREHVSETLLGLPLDQPEGRDAWFRQAYLDPRGHPINRIGVGTDHGFRPIRPDQSPVNDRLFAAGAILAHQDWARQRSGAGLAIASAFGAVRAAAERIP